MDTLSMVSKYLNDLEEYMDDGDSLEARKFTVEKSEKELEMFEALEHKSVVVELEKHRVVVFTKLDIEDFLNYMTEEMFDKLGFVRVDYGDYRRKMGKEVRVEIHGFIFLVDFVVIGYANEGEPSVIFGRDFLVTTKCKVDFGVGEMRIDLTMLEEEKDIDALVEELVETMEKIGSSNRELVKTGKASRNKSHNINKLTPPPPSPKIEEIPPLSSITPPPVYHPLSQKEKIKEALD
ncbi:homeodomain-like protein [Tanacetum coccineum]